MSKRSKHSRSSFKAMPNTTPFRMISRCSDTVIFSIDTNGESDCVAYEYDYSGIYNRSITWLGDLQHEIQYGLLGLEEKGQKLPRLNSADLASCFTDEPTQTMRRAIDLAKLEPSNITQFMRTTVHLVSWRTAAVDCEIISATGKTEKHFDIDGVPEEIFGDAVHRVAVDILEKGIDGYAAYLDSVRQK